MKDHVVGDVPVEFRERLVAFSFFDQVIEKGVAKLTATSDIAWMGTRHEPRDSLQLIGQIGTSRVFAAFGHHHIGLTGGPKTGRLVAGLVTGQPSNMDLAAYAPQRFAN